MKRLTDAIKIKSGLEFRENLDNNTGSLLVHFKKFFATAAK